MVDKTGEPSQCKGISLTVPNPLEDGNPGDGPVFAGNVDLTAFQSLYPYERQ